MTFTYDLKKRGLKIISIENILHYLWKLTKSYVPFTKPKSPPSTQPTLKPRKCIMSISM